MEDLSALSRALKEASDRTAVEGSFISLIERYLRSSDIGIRIATAETLQEIISGADEESKLRLLGDSALHIIALLIRLTPYSSSATACLNHILVRARPKEILLALSESLSEIEDETDGRAGLSDEEEGDEVEGQASPEDLIVRLDAVLLAYIQVVPRLNLQRSTPTLLTLRDALQTTLPFLIAEMDISSSRNLLRGFNTLVSTLWEWVQITSDRGGEQRAILTNMLYMAITLLSPRIDANLAERWFLARFPRYRNPSLENADAAEGQSILDGIKATLAGLHITDDDLRQTLTRRDAISPYASLASLTILASSLPLDQSTEQAKPELDNCMPVISAALSSSAIDAGLAYLWFLISPPNGCNVGYDQATMLLELLTPLAAVPQSPISNMMVTKLMAELIHSVQSQKDQMLLYKQLLENVNPFEVVRVRTLNLLREAISSPWPPLLPSFLEHLGPILFTIPRTSSPSGSSPFLACLVPPTSTLPPLDMPAEDLFGSMWPVWFTECANVLRLLLTKDEMNRTGCRDVAWLGQIKRAWVQPQMDRLKHLKSEAGTLTFSLDRWIDALERLLEAMDQGKQ